MIVVYLLSYKETVILLHVRYLEAVGMVIKMLRVHMEIPNDVMMVHQTELPVLLPMMGLVPIVQIPVISLQ